VRGVARALRPLFADLAEHGPGQPRQLEVVEEDLHELFARQREREVVGAVAAVAARAAVTFAARGTGQPVAGLELAVSGVDVLPVAAAPVPEARLGQVARRDADLAAALHVADRPAGDHVGHRLANLRPVAPHEALAIDRAAAAV